MRRTPGALALALGLACAFGLAEAARADPPLSDPSTCKSPADVVAAMSFELGFPVAKGCDKLCKKAGATCAKHVKRASTCQRKNVDDTAFFVIKVQCAGESGAALKACAKPHQDDQKAARATVDSDRDAALDQCDSKAQDCAEQCNAAP